MAYGIDEYGNDLAPPGFGPGVIGTTPGAETRDDAARRYARKRLLLSIAGGLARPVQGGFLGGLASGFSGAVAAGANQDSLRSQEVRDQEKADAEVRKDDEARRRWEAMFGLQLDQYGLQKRAEDRLLAKDLRPDRSTETAYDQAASKLQATADFLDANPDKRYLVQTDDGRHDKLVQVAGPNGLPMYVPESQAVGMQPVRERSPIKGQERTTLAFYNRAKEAENTIGTLEDKISKMSTADQFRLRFAPNIIQTPDQQVYRQAQRAFTEARLRKESGAAIPTAEYENDSRTYFAQPGDSPATIRKKRDARRVVLEGLKFASGAAYEEYYGEPNKPPARSGTVEDLGAKYGF